MGKRTVFAVMQANPLHEYSNAKVHFTKDNGELDWLGVLDMGDKIKEANSRAPKDSNFPPIYNFINELSYYFFF